ncbi:hypothetical protein EON65_47995 [archaeon]|nr:MAG: hypothetical protein EON65_47995 [archaeon]
MVDLARGSSLLREKTELSILQSTIESVLAKKITAAASNTASQTAVGNGQSGSGAATSTPALTDSAKPTQENERASKSVERMMGALDAMLKKLEV